MLQKTLYIVLNLKGIADATFNSFPLPKGIVHKAYFILDVLQVQYARFVKSYRMFRELVPQTCIF